MDAGLTARSLAATPMAVRREESSSTQDIQAANDSVSRDRLELRYTIVDNINRPETLNAITGVPQA